MGTALPSISETLADRYRIERALGQGGMAAVYLAEDVRHRRKVALKVLHPELSAVLGGERFLKEIELTANLQHPHILPLFDSGSADGQLFYVMPYVEGETLRHRMDREQQLPIVDALQLVREIADALQYAHERGVIGTGHLVYSPVTGGIFVARFDLAKHKVIGAPAPVATGVQPNGGVAPFMVSHSGTLVYRAGVDPEYHLVLREPAGRLDTLPIDPKVISYARFSPDGRRLAITIGSARGTNRHTALNDFGHRSLTRFTLEGGGHAPTWSPDSRVLAFTAEGKDTDAEDLFVQPVDQSAPPRLVLRMPNDQHATAWPTDSQLVFSMNTAPRILGGVPAGGSAWVIDPRVSSAKAHQYLNAPWGEYDVAVSPNGAWAAYTSDEGGPSEIWVRAFPSERVEGRWKVSSGGGQRARWSGDGRTLYYVTNDNASIRAVDVTPGSTLTIGANRVVLRVAAIGSAWDVDRTSRRMIVSTPVRAPATRMIVLQGWRDQLARTSGTAK